MVLIKPPVEVKSTRLYVRPPPLNVGLPEPEMRIVLVFALKVRFVVVPALQPVPPVAVIVIVEEPRVTVLAVDPDIAKIPNEHV
jgi:hypothetical protein